LSCDRSLNKKFTSTKLVLVKCK